MVAARTVTLEGKALPRGDDAPRRVGEDARGVARVCLVVREEREVLARRPRRPRRRA